MTPHPVDIHVGQRLRLRRTMLGMSQENLGSSVGITFQQIQKYEKGLNRIGSSRLFEFARILNTNIAYFFEDFSVNANSTSLGFAEGSTSFEHDLLGNKEVLTLVRAYYDIPDPAVRKKVLSLIKTLSASGPDIATDGSDESKADLKKESVVS